MTEVTAIGERLRAAREKMGLGVIQVAERMHVDAAVIEALESGQFALLGPPVYVRGHLRRYADILGEPEGPLQARYAALQEASVEPDLTNAPRMLPQPPSERALRWPLILGAGLIVLAVIIWWAMKASPAQ